MERFSDKELMLYLSGRIFRRAYQRLATRVMLGEKLDKDILATIEGEALNEITHDIWNEPRQNCLGDKVLEVAVEDARVAFDAVHRLAAFRAH